MLILFFKAVREGGPDNEPIEDKMRRILESHIEEAETDEKREGAERDLSRLLSASHR